MAFNLTGVDLDLYFDYNLAINISIFSTLVLPPFLLCLLCVVALLFAGAINTKIRVLLINIFAAEICNWLGYTVFYLGFPIRLIYSDDYSCKFFISSFVVVAVQKFTAGALYAINVYIFIKHGKKKLKWYVIIPYIVISWILAVSTLGILPYLDEFGAININGFCTTNPDSVLLMGLLPPLVSSAVFFLIIQLICSILTVIYIKKNTLEGNTTVKRAITKVLIYLVVVSILSFINSIIPSANPAIRETLPENDVIGVVAVNYILRLVFNIPTFATPIVAIVLLKPVRTAIKMICCARCLKRE